ncbi:uncharacterized protein BO97DRAFT_428364 [Aspergillus homomorphus CBS 101889]|uniref:Cyanovirin-N domain-containing protein n=1 Tax=Aspergillus homomorphus (strain CBS 101889) TaxID=1450537 RepID=A0A395HM17_ASPHC|nr:hypothetical protein BO97DRAFT_428364 [Aspergillus homomorphus CBS 101889]RAL08539.1 hypothetical protein BO97DRAFT_428364 [Aspergillus homomorphus CBS 101889]
MHLITTLPILPLTAPPSTLAEPTLPDLTLGAITGCGSNKYAPNWFAWFNNQPVCRGQDLGPITVAPNSGAIHGLCDFHVSLGNFTNVQFTGCAAAPTWEGDAGPPTGVAVDGRTVLVCEAVSEAEAQERVKCPSPCGSGFPDVEVGKRVRCVRRRA